MAPTEPRLLDSTLLDQLEGRWRAQGAHVASVLRPGLSDDEMDRLTDPIGLRLPLEARRWWGWHDGASPQAMGLDAASELGPGKAFLPLARAVSQCQRWRDVMRYAWGDDLGPDWSWDWLPIDADKRPTVFDCGRGFDAPVPVRSFFTEDPTAGAKGVRSIAELVSVWIAAIDQSVWTYNITQQRWEYHWQKVDAELAQLHLT